MYSNIDNTVQYTCSKLYYTTLSILHSVLQCTSCTCTALSRYCILYYIVHVLHWAGTCTIRCYCTCTTLNRYCTLYCIVHVLYTILVLYCTCTALSRYYTFVLYCTCIALSRYYTLYCNVLHCAGTVHCIIIYIVLHWAGTVHCIIIYIVLHWAVNCWSITTRVQKFKQYAVKRVLCIWILTKNTHSWHARPHTCTFFIYGCRWTHSCDICQYTLHIMYLYSTCTCIYM